MLPVGASLNSADNSGAKGLKLVGIPGSRKKLAKTGDVITVVIKGVYSTGTVKDHTVAKAVIVRTKKETRRNDGSYIRFDDNAAVLINPDGSIVGTRIFGPIAREIRDRGYLKIVSLAKEVF